MELNASRTAARTDAAGEPILLQQNCALWDQLQIRHGMQALRARARTGRRRRLYVPAGGDRRLPRRGEPGGRNRLGAHRAFYANGGAAPSPIVELNRAVAVGMAEGPASGAGDRGGLVDSPRSRPITCWQASRRPAVRLGRFEEARAAFEAAAALAGNRREQDLLRRRAAAANDALTPSP